MTVMTNIGMHMKARQSVAAAIYEAFWAMRPYSQVTARTDTTPKWDHLRWYW